MAVSKKLRFAVLSRDKFACQYCGASAPHVELHVDHVMARLFGGADTMENLTTACRDCNLGKRCEIVDYANVTQRQKSEADSAGIALALHELDISIWQMAIEGVEEPRYPPADYPSGPDVTIEEIIDVSFKHFGKYVRIWFNSLSPETKQKITKKGAGWV